MTENKIPSPHKKRLINKKNRSAWAISIVLISLMAIRLVAGIVRPTNARPAAAVSAPTTVSTLVYSEQDKAQSALETFYTLLAEKRYVEAVTYYGGSYDTLAAAYPQNAAAEARLFQDACDQLLCLPIHSVVDVQPDGSDGFIFTVTFAGEDGRLFTQSAADGSLVSKFPITVVKQNGRYLVQNLPLN